MLILSMLPFSTTQPSNAPPKYLRLNTRFIKKFSTKTPYTIWCVEIKLDIQARFPYSPPHKKEVLINSIHIESGLRPYMVGYRLCYSVRDWFGYAAIRFKSVYNPWRCSQILDFANRCRYITVFNPDVPHHCTIDHLSGNCPVASKVVILKAANRFFSLSLIEIRLLLNP